MARSPPFSMTSQVRLVWTDWPRCTTVVGWMVSSVQTVGGEGSAVVGGAVGDGVVGAEAAGWVPGAAGGPGAEAAGGFGAADGVLPPLDRTSPDGAGSPL